MLLWTSEVEEEALLSARQLELDRCCEAREDMRA